MLLLLAVQFFVNFIDAFHFEVGFLKNENEMCISFCKMKCKNDMQPIKTPKMIAFLAAKYSMILIVTTPSHPYTKCRNHAFHFMLPFSLQVSN